LPTVVAQANMRFAKVCMLFISVVYSNIDTKECQRAGLAALRVVRFSACVPEQGVAAK
jgi:hypothetical protein